METSKGRLVMSLVSSSFIYSEVQQREVCRKRYSFESIDSENRIRVANPAEDKKQSCRRCGVLQVCSITLSVTVVNHQAKKEIPVAVVLPSR